MASASAPLSPPCQLESFLQCSICLEVFTDPVTTPCGHSFCKQCLDCHVTDADRLCPLCKTHFTTFPGVNVTLREVAQEIKRTPPREPDEFAASPGEVACDVCTEPRLRAKKSCLVCLHSYCSTHLEFHLSAERLKGHKLVDPVNNLDSRACLHHGRPLVLYSTSQSKCVCVRCLEEDLHDVVVSAETGWRNKMAEMADVTAKLQQKISERMVKLQEVNAALKVCKDHLEKDWWDIEAVFTAVIAIAEQAQAALLQPLTKRREAVEKEAADIKSELDAEIKRFETAISELDDISALEDHVLFLQRYPSVPEALCGKDWTEVELDTSLCFGTMRKITTKVMEKIQEELEKLTTIELRRMPVFKVDVRLDSMTAHRCLVVSTDGKQVRDGGEDQNVADHPERFELFGSVIGLQSFSSGRAYWEVEVYDKSGWDLGVVSSDVSRRGMLSVNPDNGYWVVTQYRDTKYAALTVPPHRLWLAEKPEKVGVFVDYEEGLVSFYDATARSHIYSFTECTFKKDLYPYFGPHLKQNERNLQPLSIAVL